MAGLIEVAQTTIEDGDLSGKAQVFAVIGTVLFLGLVVELVRRRRLVERYALLWMSTALLGVVLAVWNGGLNWLADRLGIISPVNALFLIGLVAVFGLLLNFSVAISRLSEETKILAQTVSRLDADLRALSGRAGNGRSNGAEPEDDAAEQRAGSAGSE
jgi:hypothetical protein